jgi:hypothetical protein
MKKIIISVFMFLNLNSFSQEYDTIYCEKDIEAARRNMSTMIQWVKDDYLYGDVPRYIYDNYMLVLTNTEYSLKLLLEKPNTKTRFIEK